MTGDYVSAAEGEYNYQLVDGYDPVGGSSNSVTGVYVTVADDDAASGSSGQGESGQGVSGSGGDCEGCGTAGDEGVLGQGQSPYAELVARMREWRNDPKWVSFAAHTERWDRALMAFGETVADGSLTAMTAAEAQGFADRGEAWSRWVEVAAALQAIEAAAQPPAGQQADPAPQVVSAQSEPQTAPNQAPVVSSALADATIAHESGTLELSLAGVFRDADRDALTVAAASSERGRGQRLGRRRRHPPEPERALAGARP